MTHPPASAGIRTIESEKPTAESDPYTTDPLQVSSRMSTPSTAADGCTSITSTVCLDFGSAARNSSSVSSPSSELPLQMSDGAAL